MTSFGVLGALEVRRGDRSLELPGLRHRAVLARLLVARGRVVPVDKLIDDLWGDEQPGQAIAAIQTFVARLRKTLEPDRPPRAAARLLVTVPPGYAIHPDPDQVDAWRFERLVHQAGERLGADPADAAQRLHTALGLWRGPAFAEFAGESWALGEAERLEELRRVAVERAAEAGLRLGRAMDVVADLEAHVAAHPLREEGWRLLALGRYACGRQADALAALRRARDVLRDELGVDPGPTLRRLESDILAHAEHLVLAAPARPAPPAPPVERAPPAELFVGRDAELAQLMASARTATPGLVLLSGDAGAGKTTLLSQLASRLGAHGWTVGRGRCVETDGAPPGWPWAEALRELAARHPPTPSSAAALGWLLCDDTPSDPDPVSGRHRTHRAVREYLVGLAGQRPLLLILDDLHQADDETLSLLTGAAAELADHRALVVLALRGAETSERLEETLATLARHLPHRVELTGLPRWAVGAIISAECSTEVEPHVVAAITERTDGNPFFVRETARLLEAEGATAAVSAVPAGVRDVLRRRIARLPGIARTVLADAAVIGHRIEFGLLVDLTGSDEDIVLDALEAAVLLGLLVEPAPGRVEFPHALVRETLYESMSRLRRGRLHARIAAALQRFRPDDVAALAHHFDAADDPALARQVSRYARLAAEDAERRFAHREAAALWRRSLAAFDDDQGVSAPVQRLELLLGQVRALALAGEVPRARVLRAESLREAAAVDDPVLTARVIASFDVPTIWIMRPYGTVETDIVALSERTLRQLPSSDSEPRCRLLVNLAFELAAADDDCGRAAAREAEAMARRLGDPQLLAMALNGVFLQSYWVGRLAERERVGAELLTLARQHGWPAIETLGWFVLAQVHAARGEVAAAADLVAAAERLAETHEQPWILVVTAWYHGMRQLVAGRLELALAAYGEAVRRMARAGMWHEESAMIVIAKGCAWLSLGRTLAELLEELDAYAGDRLIWQELRALALADAGRIDEARAVAATQQPPVPRDWFYELRWTLRGLLAVAVNDAEQADHAHRVLLPYADLVAGGNTGNIVIGPVAQVLGNLAEYRGEPVTAAAHYRQAAEIARRAGAPHWTAAAETRSRRSGTLRQGHKAALSSR